MSKPRLVVCSGLEIPKTDPLCKGRHVVHLDTLDDEGNVNLHIENVTRAFERNMPDRVVDLLEIAAYVFAADCSARRGGAWTNEETEEPWGRDFHFVVPVREPSFWERDEVQSALIGALRFMSSDTFGFTFRRLQSDRPIQRYLEIGDLEDSPFYEAERVVMFSGGLDSLAGAVEVAAAGLPLVAVSHWPAPHLSSLQTSLMQQVRERLPGPIRHIPVCVNKHHLDSEASQRTRSFLFSALGVAAASVLHAGGVRFYENGVTTLNWPMAQEVLQSRATRSTHPVTLHRLQEFYRLVTERPQFALDNPFVFNTKTEVVSKIAGAGVPELIGLSASCIHTRRQTSERRHCGVCRQCLDRRIAITAAGQEAHEWEGDYRSDVFTGPREGDYEHNIAVDYARFASDLDQLEVSEIGSRYIRELTLATRYYEHQTEVAQRFIDMHKRHAKSVWQVLDAQLAAHVSDLRAGRLDRTSLLGMIQLREHLGEAATPMEATGAQTAKAASVASGTRENVFLRRGEQWTLAYGGNPVSLTHRKGLTQIRYLLKHPEKEFTAVGLVELTEERLRAGASIPALSTAAMMEEGLHPADQFSGQPIQDARSAAYAQSRIRELDELVASAERDGDQPALEWAQGERRKLITSLAGAFGKNRRARGFRTDASKARDAVEKNIYRALSAIASHHGPLAQHLRSALRRREPFAYKPDRHLDWQTD